MLRITLNCLVLFLFFCSCSSARQSCVLPPGIFSEVATLRALPKKNDVPCIQTNSTSELREILSETIDKRLPREQLVLEGEILRLLGIIPKNYDYRERVISLYASRLNAFYSPEFKRFVLARNSGLEKKTILAHELTHALQDQYYDLNTLTAVTVPSDTVMARTAVFEGDANLLMRRYSGEPFCQASNVKQILERLNHLKEQKSEVPLFFELQIAFPYLIGEQYLCERVNESRKTAGGGLNEALAKVYSSLPHSTSQLLGLPDTRDLTGADCLKSDVYGAAGIAGLLAQEVSLVHSVGVLKTLVGDRLCLNQVSENKFKLDWRVKVEDVGDRARLRDMFSNYFSIHAKDKSYSVTDSNGQIEIRVSN